MRRSLTALLLGLALTGTSLRAHAQSAAELVAARSLFAEGQDLEKKKDYAAALERFRKVAAIKSTAIVRYHEGFCAERLGRWIEALDAWAKATVEGQGDPKQKSAVEAARKASDALRPRVPRIHAKLAGAPKGKYQIRIDGTPVSEALLDTPVPVDVGKHLVELSGEGLVSEAQSVTVGEKETREVVFEAKDPLASAPPAPIETPPTNPPIKDEKKAPPPPPKPEAPKPASERRAPAMSLLFGFSFGNTQPGGQLVDPGTANVPRFAREGNSDQLEYLGAGLALEPRIGFRFLRPVAVYAFWQHGFLGKSGHSQDSADFSGSTDAYGGGLTLLTHPSGAFGGYGDVFAAMRTTRYDDRTSGEKATFSGREVGLKLGLSYKPTPTFTLLGFASASLGSYGAFTYEDTNDPAQKKDEAIDKTASYSFFGLGLGATFDLALKP